MEEQGAGVGLVAAVWAESAAAERALHALRAGGSIGPTGIAGAVTLVVDRAGDLRTTDLAGRTGDGGAVDGALGAAIGLLTSGIGWLPLDTDAIDALAAEARRGGLPDGGLMRLGERMTRRSSALVAVVERSWLDGTALALEVTGAETVPEVLDAALVARLGDRDHGWPSGRVGDVIALRTGAAVMRALDSTPAATV